MNIYLMEQRVNEEYDTYDSVVVIAESEEEARKIHPSSFITHIESETWMMGDKNYSSSDMEWVSPSQLHQIEVTLIGKASAEQHKGVVLASFNAG